MGPQYRSLSHRSDRADHPISHSWWMLKLLAIIKFGSVVPRPAARQRVDEPSSSFRRASQVCLVAVAAALPLIKLTHALELPGKMRLDKDAYLATQPIYHSGFTSARRVTVVGGVGEGGGGRDIDPAGVDACCNRLGGNWLVETSVFGRRASEAGAEYSQAIRAQGCDPKTISEARDALTPITSEAISWRGRFSGPRGTTCGKTAAWFAMKNGWERA